MWSGRSAGSATRRRFLRALCEHRGDIFQDHRAWTVRSRCLSHAFKKVARRYGFVYNLGMRRDHIKYSFTTDTLAVCTSQPAVPDKDDGKSGRRCTQLVAQFIYAAPMTYPSDVIQLTEVIHGQQRLPKGQPRRGGPRERYTLGSIPFRLQENL